MSDIASLADVQWNGGVVVKSDKAVWQARAETLAGTPVDRLVWQTPESIPAPPLFTSADLHGIPCLAYHAGLSTLPSRAVSHDVRAAPLDGAAIYGLFHR